LRTIPPSLPAFKTNTHTSVSVPFLLTLPLGLTATFRALPFTGCLYNVAELFLCHFYLCCFSALDLRRSTFPYACTCVHRFISTTFVSFRRKFFFLARIDFPYFNSFTQPFPIKISWGCFLSYSMLSPPLFDSIPLSRRTDASLPFPAFDPMRPAIGNFVKDFSPLTPPRRELLGSMKFPRTDLYGLTFAPPPKKHLRCFLLRQRSHFFVCRTHCRLLSFFRYSRTRRFIWRLRVISKTPTFGRLSLRVLFRSIYVAPLFLLQLGI